MKLLDYLDHLESQIFVWFESCVLNKLLYSCDADVLLRRLHTYRIDNGLKDLAPVSGMRVEVLATTGAFRFVKWR